MKLVKISALAALLCTLDVSANAQDTKPKRELKNNMIEVYNVLPKNAENLAEAFTNGMFYGRLRMNAFKWDWKDVPTDNKAFGLGGSVIYKTAPLKGISATAGLYTSSSPIPAFREDAVDFQNVKSGKDTFSRYEVANGNGWNMLSLAQAYIQYNLFQTTFKGGRQIFESFLTKSNDTKMIPNTFEGLSVDIKEIPKTRIRGAYFYSQKLRDHTTFHDVLTYNDGSTNPYADWNNNDDSGVHKGLSYANFSAAGKDTHHALIVADISNKSIENLQVDVTYGGVADVVSSITGELNYMIGLPAGFTLTPGVRHMKQMDNGGGKIGGASLSGKLVTWTTITPTYNATNGYSTPDGLEGSISMARLVLAQGPMKAQIAYSAVSDEADIVAPWRGFPTSGYTHAMAQSNWIANTQTTSTEVQYDFSKAKIIPGFSAMVRYAMQDFDESKQAAGVQADSNILHMALRQQLARGLNAKFRFGFVSADPRVGSTDIDSYNEYRFEINYLF